ncbi:MAG: hypothetical protein HY716_12255 [Planctomycetes bacterium]|nr:hypothetical protein [Planctomycetota bacterium]
MKRMQKPDDQPDVGAGCAGDSDVVPMLLIKHRADLYAYLLAAVWNSHDAEDLLQEVSLVALRSAAQYKPGTNFLAWVREISRHRLLEHLERARRGAMAVPPGALERMEKVALEVEAAGDLDRQRQALDEYLEELGGAYRRVITLRRSRNSAGPGRRNGRTNGVCSIETGINLQLFVVLSRFLQGRGGFLPGERKNGCTGGKSAGPDRRDNAS